MLTAEVAKERLKGWRIDPDDDRFLRGIKALPANVRALPYGLVGRDEKGLKMDDVDWSFVLRLRHEAARVIASFSDRSQEFGALFGKSARWIEKVFDNYSSLPYPSGHMHKPFRAPRCAETALRAGIVWLTTIVDVFQKFQADIPTPAWLAVWAPYLERFGSQDEIGQLLAGAIDAGGEMGDEVFEILCQIVRNEHEIGVMGAHVTRGLLAAVRVEGWESHGKDPPGRAAAGRAAAIDPGDAAGCPPGSL